MAAGRVLVAVMCVGLVLTPAAAAQSRGASARRAGVVKQFRDVRDAQRLAVARRGVTSLHHPSPDADAARARLRFKGARVEIDPLTGTPRVLAGAPALSGPSGDDPLEIAARFLREHLAVLGLDREDLGSLSLVGRSPIPGGAVQIAYRQFADGIPSFDGGIRVTVDRAGRVLQVTGTPQPDLSLSTDVPALSAGDALRTLMDDVGVPRPVRVTSGPRGIRRVTGFRADAAAAALTSFADGDGARLAWQVDYRAAPLAHYHALVDVATGAILYRVNSVKTAANDASVFEHYPGAANGGTQQTRALTPYLSVGATDLSGPYAHAWSDLNDNDSSDTDSNDHIVPLDAPDSGETVARSAGGDFVFPFTDFTPTNTFGACDAAHKCSWNADDLTSWQTNRRQNAVQAFWYVNRWRDHLVAAPISFSTSDGNFEGADRVLVNTDDGADTGPGGGPDGDHVDNAYMDTPRDGTSPTMAMFLFFNDTSVDGDFRDANGGDDAEVVYHEYTHGLSSRLVTGSGGDEALNSGQAAAMGEGWSDFYAEDFLIDEFPSDDSPTPGEIDLGRYLDSRPHMLRTQGLDCPVGAPAAQCPGTPAQGSGGYTYGDYNAVDKTGVPPQAEPHQAGEIWGETLWDLRGVLGSSLTEAIVTQGMRLSPPEPTFLEERDAILAADRQLFPGADHSAQIWAVFANRGMGTNASSPTKDVVVEGFDRSPASPPGRQPPSSLAHPAAPVLKLPRSGSRGRVRLTVTCDSPCSGRARLTVSRRAARHLHLRGRTVGSTRIKRTAAGKSTVTVKLTARTLRALRRGRASTLKATLTVTITDGERQRTAAHRGVRIRRR